MPIDPNTGMYAEPEPSPFPGGIFGSALAIGNNQIGGQLAAQANTTRQLQQHLLDLRGQQEEVDLVDKVRKQRDLEDQHKKALEFQKLLLSDGDMKTGDKINIARSQGLESTANDLERDQYHEDLVGAKSDTLSKNYTEEARKFVVDEFSKVGANGADIADLGRTLYPKDQVPAGFWDKVALRKQGAMAQASIGAKNAQATKAGAKPPAADTSDKIDATLYKMDKDISNALIKIKALPLTQQHAAKRDTVDPLIQARDSLAAKNGKRLFGAKADAVVPKKSLTPTDPHPSQTTAAPVVAPPPKLKPNWTYKIDGKIVTTDQDGNVIQ
jgi:hypothetical protein